MGGGAARGTTMYFLLVIGLDKVEMVCLVVRQRRRLVVWRRSLLRLVRWSLVVGCRLVVCLVGRLSVGRVLLVVGCRGALVV